MRTPLLVAAAAAATTFAVGVLVTTAPVRAEPPATVALTPASGTVDATPMFTSALTSGPCPTGYGVNATLQVGRKGDNLSTYRNLAPGTSGVGDTQPVTLAPTRSLTKALGAAPAPGDCDVVVRCFSAADPPKTCQPVGMASGGSRS